MEISRFRQEAMDLSDRIISWRRDFHKHPELGFQEKRSSEIIAQTLRELKFEVQTGIAGTGIVGHLIGEEPGPIILLRFDMDALPIQEKSSAAYASINPGVMHACGHDGHMAIGLAVATILQAHKDELTGGIKFVFQPAEEILGGAERMIEEGVLQDPVPNFCLAAHLWNEKPEGWIGISAGPIMAGAEKFEIVLIGKGGHGAIPDQTRDPIHASAHLITALQSIVSRNVDPRKTAVISVGQIQAGDAYNIIPESAILRGTIRTFDSDVRQLVLRRVETLSTKIASAFECEVDVKIESVAPPVVNDGQVAQIAHDVTRELYPEANIEEDVMSMVSEDMALMMESVPGCYLLVGSNDAERGLDAPHHSPYFDFNENALTRATAIMAATAWKISERK